MNLFSVTLLLNNAGAARRHYSFTLLKKSFLVWVERWQRQIELAQFEDLISFKGDVAVARRAFVHWRYCIQLLIHVYCIPWLD